MGQNGRPNSTHPSPSFLTIRSIDRSIIAVPGQRRPIKAPDFAPLKCMGSMPAMPMPSGTIRYAFKGRKRHDDADPRCVRPMRPVDPALRPQSTSQAPATHPNTERNMRSKYQSGKKQACGGGFDTGRQEVGCLSSIGAASSQRTSSDDKRKKGRTQTCEIQSR